METDTTLPWDSLPAELAARIAADLMTANELDCGGAVTDGELIAELASAPLCDEPLGKLDQVAGVVSLRLLSLLREPPTPPTSSASSIT